MVSTARPGQRELWKRQRTFALPTPGQGLAGLPAVPRAHRGFSRPGRARLFTSPPLAAWPSGWLGPLSGRPLLRALPRGHREHAPLIPGAVGGCRGPEQGRHQGPPCDPLCATWSIPLKHQVRATPKIVFPLCQVVKFAAGKPLKAVSLSPTGIGSPACPASCLASVGLSPLWSHFPTVTSSLLL